MAEIEFSQRAAERLRDAEPAVQEQVRKRPSQAEDFPDHFLVRLSNTPFFDSGGDHRAVIDWRRNDDVLFIREIGHRDSIYE